MIGSTQAGCSSAHAQNAPSLQASAKVLKLIAFGLGRGDQSGQHRKTIGKPWENAGLMGYEWDDTLW